MLLISVVKELDGCYNNIQRACKITRNDTNGGINPGGQKSKVEVEVARPGETSKVGAKTTPPSQTSKVSVKAKVPSVGVTSGHDVSSKRTPKTQSLGTHPNFDVSVSEWLALLEDRQALKRLSDHCNEGNCKDISPLLFPR